MEAGNRYGRGPSPLQRQERTDVRHRYPEREVLDVVEKQESEQRLAGGTAENMRERINTFETVLNIDQFLVRFLMLCI